MNRLERVDDPITAALAQAQGSQASLWTALPGLVKSFNSNEMTVTVQPQMQAQVTQQDGSIIFMDYPLLVDVPVVFQTAGGYALTFPVKDGDECLVVFASRSIDTWWSQGPKQKGDLSPVTDLRMHDLSDGFALIGPRSRPNVIQNISSSGVELRNEAGDAVIRIDDSQAITINTTGNVSVNAGGDANVHATGALNMSATNRLRITCPLIDMTGTVRIRGNLGTEGFIQDGNGRDLSTHVHTNVESGDDVSGPPA